MSAYYVLKGSQRLTTALYNKDIIFTESIPTLSEKLRSQDPGSNTSQVGVTDCKTFDIINNIILSFCGGKPEHLLFNSRLVSPFHNVETKM